MNRSRYTDTDLQDDVTYRNGLGVARVSISRVEIVERYQYRFHKPSLSILSHIR